VREVAVDMATVTVEDTEKDEIGKSHTTMIVTFLAHHPTPVPNQVIVRPIPAQVQIPVLVPIPAQVQIPVLVPIMKNEDDTEYIFQDQQDRLDHQATQ
jgi:hypothetical protein